MPVVTTSRTAPSPLTSVHTGNSAQSNAPAAAAGTTAVATAPADAAPPLKVSDLLGLIDAAAVVVNAKLGPSPHIRMAQELVSQQRAVIYAVEPAVLLSADLPAPCDDAAESPPSVLRVALHGSIAEPHGPGARTSMAFLQQSNAVVAEVPWHGAFDDAVHLRALDAALTMRPVWGRGGSTASTIAEMAASVAAGVEGDAHSWRLQQLSSFLLLKWIGTAGASLHMPDEASIVRGLSQVHSPPQAPVEAAQPFTLPCVAVAVPQGGTVARAPSAPAAALLRRDWFAFTPMASMRLGAMGIQAAAWNLPNDKAAQPGGDVVASLGLEPTELPQWPEALSLVPLPSSSAALGDSAKAVQHLVAKCAPIVQAAKRLGSGGATTTTTFVVRIGATPDSTPVLPHQLPLLVKELHLLDAAVVADLTHPSVAASGGYFTADWASIVMASGVDMVLLPHPKAAPSLWNAVRRATESVQCLHRNTAFSLRLRSLGGHTTPHAVVGGGM